MELIFTDNLYKEIGYLKQCDIDMEVGSVLTSNATNDFTISMAIDKLPPEIIYGSLIYEIGTEFGGIVNGIGADTALNKATIYGTLWRGMLSKKIIVPPANQAYYQVRGEANKAIRNLIDTEFDSLITGSTEVTKIEVYRDYRFTNMLEGIEKMLAEQNARISIKSVRQNEDIKVIVSAIQISNYSNEIELNNDYGITLNAKKIQSGVNHIICLGKGELLDRIVIHLYKTKEGSITTDDAYAIKGIDERTIIYDYSSAENETDLIEGGKKKFIENADEENLNIAISSNVEIGDIVSARERITGIFMQKQITQKLAKGYIDRVKIDYKVGE